MPTMKFKKHMTWIRLITFTVIIAFLCQNIAWAGGEMHLYLEIKIEDKLSPVSDVNEIPGEWNIISLALAIYNMYGFKDGRITANRIDSAERIKEKLLRRYGRLDAYRRHVERIKDVILGEDGLIYIRYLLNDKEEILLRIVHKTRQDSYRVLAETEIGDFRVQILTAGQENEAPAGNRLLDGLKSSLVGLDSKEIRRLESNLLTLLSIFDYEIVAQRLDLYRIDPKSPEAIERFRGYVNLLLNPLFPLLKDIRLAPHRGDAIRIFESNPERFLRFLIDNGKPAHSTWALEKSSSVLQFSVAVSLVIAALLTLLLVPMGNFYFMLNSPFISGLSLFIEILLKTALYADIYLLIIFPVNFTIIHTVMVLIFRKKFLSGRSINNKFYAQAPLEKVEGAAVTEGDYTSVTVMIPVHKEPFEVIKQTIQSALRAIDYYNKRHIEQANIIMSDDSLMLYTKNRLKAILAEYDTLTATERIVFYNNLSPDEQMAIDRVSFYRRYNIPFVARPMPDERYPATERRGTFKKGGNLNFTLRLADLKTEREFRLGQTGSKALEGAILDLVGPEAAGMAHAEGDIKIGAVIMQVDKDSLVDEKMIHYAMPEFSRDPALAFTQHRSYPANEENSGFTKTVGFFTRLLYDAAIPFKSFIGSHPPFMGHNGFIRTAALKETGLWNEDRATEDLHFSLQIMSLGYHGKYIAFEDTNFHEYVTEDYEEEARKYTRYSYGMVQEVFNRRRSEAKGVFTAVFKKWLLHPKIAFSYKFDLLVYFCSYLNLLLILPMLFLSTVYDIETFHPVVILFFILSFVQIGIMRQRRDIDKSFLKGHSWIFTNIMHGTKIALMFYGYSRYIIEGIISFFLKLKPNFSPTVINQETLNFGKWIKRNTASIKINLMLLLSFAAGFIYLSSDPVGLLKVCSPFVLINLFVAYLMDPYLISLSKSWFNRKLRLFIIVLLLFMPISVLGQQNGSEGYEDYVSESTGELSETYRNHPAVIFYLRLEQDPAMQAHFNYIYNTTFVSGMYNRETGRVDIELLARNMDLVRIIINIVSSPNFNMDHHLELMPKVHAFLLFMKEAAIYYRNDYEANQNFALNADIPLSEFAGNPVPVTIGFSFNLLGMHPNLDFNEWLSRMLNKELLEGRTPEGEEAVNLGFNKLGDNKDDFTLILGKTPDGNHQSTVDLLRDVAYDAIGRGEDPYKTIEDMAEAFEKVRKILEKLYGENWRQSIPDQATIGRLFDLVGDPNFNLDNFLDNLYPLNRVEWKSWDNSGYKRDIEVELRLKPWDGPSYEEDIEPEISTSPQGLPRPVLIPKDSGSIREPTPPPQEPSRPVLTPKKVRIAKNDSFIINVNQIRLLIFLTISGVLLSFWRRIRKEEKKLIKTKIPQFSIIFPKGRKDDPTNRERLEAHAREILSAA